MSIQAVRIMGMDHRIVGDTEMILARNHRGEYCSSTAEIRLAPELCPAQQGETMVHEILEALAEKLDIRDQPYTHRVLSAQAEALYGALRDNPGLVRAILAGRRIV